MKVNDFPFGDLLKKAWTWTYKNKLLWVIAFFAGSGGYFFNLMPSGDDLESFSEASPSFANFVGNIRTISFEAPLVILGAIVIVLVLAILYVLNLAARAAVIRGLNQINSGSKYRFWELAGYGFRRMPRFLLISIIWGIPNVFLMILMVVGALLGAWYGISLLAISGVAFLLYNIYIALLRHYAYCEAILNEKSAWNSIIIGAKLVNKNFWIVLVSALIQIGLAMAIGLGMFLAVIIVAIPFVLLGAILTLAMGSLGIVIPAIIGGVAILALAAVLRGGISFYFNTFLTQIYWKLEK